jgi:predicted nuclease of predicted toxin-antitoxin system
MRILIDECIDERFRTLLSSHDCQTVRYTGLAGRKNGELLRAAEEAKFDAFLTVDHGIEYQQDLTGRNIAIIILRPKSNRLSDLLPHVSACLAHIESITPVKSLELAARFGSRAIKRAELVCYRLAELVRAISSDNLRR